MSTQPRVLFTRFPSSTSPKLQPWRDHFAGVVGVPPVEHPSDSGAVVWHLVSANNRVLARSGVISTTFETAVEDALAATGAELEAIDVGDERRRAYGWYLAAGADAVITCARWYFSDRDRHHSVEIASDALTCAVLHTEARMINPMLMAPETL